MTKHRPLLTRKGQFLYWILREVSGEELTPVEFVDRYLCGVPSGPEKNCIHCGRVRRLIESAFCLGCTGGAIAP